MELKAQKLIDNLRRVHGHEINAQIIYSVFKLTSEIQNHAIIDAAFNQANNISLKHVPAEIVALEYIFTFKNNLPDLEIKIKKNTSAIFYKLYLARNLAETHLNVKIHERSLLAHTLSTVQSLAEVNPDFPSLYAAYLKHLPEFSSVTVKELQKTFGSDVANIVQSANKLKNFNRITENASHESLQQLILASSKDTRVIILKMCSLIDLLKNIDQIKEKHRIRTATEAMYIYAPIADILGLWRLKWQLEDYAFKFLQPEDFKNIDQKFNVDEKKNREKYIDKTVHLLQKVAENNHIECQINGRFKHFYGIYQKMIEKQKNFNEIYDVFALRVLVKTTDDCYKMLKLIHSIWNPVPDRIKDYISAPKKNNYRSLHTTVYGLNRRPTEFQIRTPEMDHEARFGQSSHWFYKNNRQSLPEWALKIIHLNRSKNQDKDWVQINTEILFDKVFAFTPKGDMISLPKGATIIDFAYHIHSQVGHSCCGAKVNGQPVDLAYPLNNEDVVEIITDPKQFAPRLDWLNFATTSIAKKKITQALDPEPKHEISH